MKSQLNISPEDLNLLGDIDYNDPNQEEAIKKAERKYIRLFLEAQETTNSINDGGFFGTGIGSEGSVYVKTVNDGASDTSSLKDMTITDIEDLQNKVSSGASNVWNYFSINNSGQLVLPTMNNNMISLTTIDYKSMISQYSTPWNFFIDLEMIVQNPKFMEAFVDLVKKSKINLTVLYNTTYTKETIVHEYEETETTTDSNNNEITTTVMKTETTVNEYNSKTPTLVITSADTWIYSREASYKSNTNGPIVSGPYTEGNEKDKTTTTVETTTTTYVQDGVTKEEYNGGQKGESGTFVGLLDRSFKIPNSSRYAQAGESLVSGAEMFFELLAKAENTKDWEEIMRYVLYVYTGTDYGVTNFEDILKYLQPQLRVMGYDYSVNTGFITDVGTLKDAISKVYSGKTKENLLAEAEHFIAMQEQYNVDATFAIAVTIIESSGGTAWSAIAEFTHNWMSVTGSYNGQTYRNPNSSNPRTWRVYPSYEAAILDFGDLIANSSYYYQNGKYTVKAIAPTYCNEEWGNSVVAEMTKLLTAAGVSVDTGEANEIQLKVAEIAQNSAAYGIIARSGYCLGWVNDVYQAAGATVERKDCARCSGNAFSVSNDFSSIPVGAAIYKYSSTSEGVKYGHVGIYVGNGMVYHNVGYVKADTLQDFISGHKEACWGWTSSTPINQNYPLNPGLILAGHNVMYPIP